MVDDWRRGQIDVPSRAEAIRRMVELAINAKKKPAISAGVEFTDENGGGPGVRLRKPPKQRTGDDVFAKRTQSLLKLKPRVDLGGLMEGGVSMNLKSSAPPHLYHCRLGRS
jgi:hypothetical protein